MCRFVHFVGLGREGLGRVVKGFRLASIHDFVLDEVRRGRRSHVHGWGAACVYMRFGELGIGYLRTSLPLLEEDVKRFVMAVPRDVQWIHVVMHSRLTVSEPINVFNSHPFYVDNPGGVSLWLVHNGSVDKRVLAEKLDMVGLVERYADSFFLAHWIARNIDRVDVDAVSAALKSVVDLGAVKTALNCAGILIDSRSSEVASFSANFSVVEDIKQKRYYQLYLVTPSQRTAIATSSTVAYYLETMFSWQITPLENGEIVFTTAKDKSIHIERKKFL